MPRITPTLAEIAADYTLWGEYSDVDGLDSREQFEALGQSARVQLLRDAFGPPETCDHCGRNPYEVRSSGLCPDCSN